MSACHAWPFTLPHREVDWKLLLPLPYHSSFLSLLESSCSRQLRGRKNHYLDLGQQLDGSFKISGISWPECFSRHFRECILTLLLSAFQPCFPKGWGGWDVPSRWASYLPVLFLLTKAFRKRLVEISKIQWIYIFNCSAPLAQTHYFFSNSFGHEQFCKYVQFKIAI